MASQIKENQRFGRLRTVSIFLTRSRMDFATGLVFVLVFIIFVSACFCARGDRSRRRGGHLLSPLSGLWPSDDDHTSGFGFKFAFIILRICMHSAHSKCNTGSVNLSDIFNSRYGVVRPSSCPMLCSYFQNCRKIKYRSPIESIEWFKEKSQPPPGFSKKLQRVNHMLLDIMYRRPHIELHP